MLKCVVLAAESKRKTKRSKGKIMVNKETKESGGDRRERSRPEGGEIAATDERKERGFLCEKG